ncbi:MAG: SMC-Scp complex subunit ScpB [Candidatus Wenzhouxiangella sp. M2_3B_020]
MNESEAPTEGIESKPETAGEAPDARQPEALKTLLEAALLAAGQPLNLNQLNALFDEDEQPGHGPIREALALLDAELADRAVELVEVAGGYRLQIRQKFMPVVSKLWAEKPPRYSRALLETLAIIAYRQPITRGEIEQIRGVSLSANILKTLQEREWIKVVGHRDIPGKPELLGTTRAFLDYFGLKGLDDLPTLAEIRDIDNLEPELELNDPDHPQAANDERQTEEGQTESSRDEEVERQEAQAAGSGEEPADDSPDVVDGRESRSEDRPRTEDE